MTLRAAGAVKIRERRTSNFQHRTSNIDDAALYLILKQANRSLRRAQPNRISKSRFAPGLRSHFGGVGLLSFFKIDRLTLRPSTGRIHYSMLDVQCSMFIF